MLKLVNLNEYYYESNKLENFTISSLSKFSDDIWDFKNEEFIQKDKKTKYLIDFNIKVDGHELKNPKYYEIKTAFKSIIYYLIKDISFLTVRSYVHDFKHIFKYMAKNKIHSFSKMNENSFLALRNDLFNEYGVGSIQANKVFQLIKHITEKRKMIPYCYSEKLFNGLSTTEISLYKRDYSKQTEVIPDEAVKNIILKCNRVINNSQDLINLKTEYSNLFLTYKYDGLNGEFGRKKMIRKKFLKDNKHIKSSVEFKNSVDTLMVSCFILISLYTGMRIGEVLSIPVDCIKKKTTLNGQTEYDIFYIKGTTYKYSDNKFGVQETNDIRSEWLANGEVSKAVSVLHTLFKYEYNNKNIDNLFFSEVSVDEFNNYMGQNIIIPKMKAFLEEFGDINHHQFRRTFARLVARSAFCDVDILKEHFKHKNKEITEYYMRGDVDNEFIEFIEDDKNEIKKSILWDALLEKAKKDLGDNFKDFMEN